MTMKMSQLHKLVLTKKILKLKIKQKCCNDLKNNLYTKNIRT